ncbi:hypothetical protein N7488_008368 [Penicillium malachiteum]|nr:hypothetical protein N7488_008368 [Penicillium malachiteum]
MESTAPTFLTLPVEMKIAILKYLDPIALISCSQTCQYFRHLISPQQRHFVERLLALECQENEGGITPIFRARDNQLVPDWNTPEWNSMRWACCSCLRLLPHGSFDNHALLRLRFRKPIPGSPAAYPVASWGILPQSRGMTREQRAKHIAEGKVIRRRYATAVTRNWGHTRMRLMSNVAEEQYLKVFEDLQDMDWPIFQEMTFEEYRELSFDAENKIMDDEARAIELERCGSKRKLRKCNECRFTRGELKPRGRGGGTEKVPIVPSRRVPVASAFDRYFPGLSTCLGIKRPSQDMPIFMIYRENAHERWWAMYMVRCPGCAQWQESRNFRFGHYYTHWQPANGHDRFFNPQEIPLGREDRITDEFINSLRCNKCLLNKHGRDALRHELLQWFGSVHLSHRLGVQHDLCFGWNWTWNQSSECPAEYKQELMRIVTKPYKIFLRMQNRESNERHLNLSDVAVSRQHFDQLNEFYVTTKGTAPSDWYAESDWIHRWLDEYDVLESHWYWLHAVQTKVEEKPDALIEWAMVDSARVVPMRLEQ